MDPQKIRNIAIIAHVDHGKTTLVDKLLQQTGTLQHRDMQHERVMDSNDLEKERGITILSKNTAIDWKGHRINIVDTPGHADFGGEVERILSMVDSVLLLVDAVEGPMPQTRFVTQKAFAKNLKPIVVVNKIDRDGARPDWVIDQVFELFDQLGATDEQLDFPIVYASALSGFAGLNYPDIQSKDLNPLLDMMLERVQPPQVQPEGPLQMQVSALDYSSYVGVIGIGRIQRGVIKENQPISVVDRRGEVRAAKIGQVLGYLGLDRQPVPDATAGDIVAITGIENLAISETICDKTEPEGLPVLKVDEPTISMTFQVNDSPFAGKEGKFLTSRQILERLDRELLYNVALRVEPTADPDKFKVSGRGELHLAVLIETMRREGYELAVSRPEVIIKETEQGTLEPYENLVAEVDTEHQGTIMQQLAERGGQLQDMVVESEERVRLSYYIPSRGLIGFYTEFQSLTSGTGMLTHVFAEYAPMHSMKPVARKQGVLIANAPGVALAYALWNLQARGKLCIGPQTDVYEGMIVGLHSRENDLVVNVSKGKQLTNVRAAGSDENIVLTPPIPVTLEYGLSFLNADELLEITPVAIRLRKKKLKAHERKRDK